MTWTLRRPQDTGWRKLVPLGTVTGDLWMKRSGPLVELATRAVVPGAAGVVDLVTIPVGFQPHAASSTRLGTLSTDANVAAMASYFSGKFRVINGTATGAFGGRILWTTSDPWPSSLPGSAA